MNRIDLNGDLGESFGTWRMGDDDALLALLSSANIACGFHAGDPEIMRHTVAQAVAHGVAIGAHVSLPDLQGFGRREMNVTAAEAYALTLYQIGALHAFTCAAGARLTHVKPHGALYNMAARDTVLADAIARATCDFDPQLWQNEYRERLLTLIASKARGEKVKPVRIVKKKPQASLAASLKASIAAAKEKKVA